MALTDENIARRYISACAAGARKGAKYVEVWSVYYTANKCETWDQVLDLYKDGVEDGVRCVMAIGKQYGAPVQDYETEARAVTNLLGQMMR